MSIKNGSSTMLKKTALFLMDGFPYFYTKTKCAVYILLTKIVGLDAREKLCVRKIQYSFQSMKYFQEFLQTKVWDSCCCGSRIWCCNCQFSEGRPSKKDFIFKWNTLGFSLILLCKSFKCIFYHSVELWCCKSWCI